MFWPSVETTWHRDEFIERLPAELRAQIVAANRPGFEPHMADGGVSASLPNGAVLVIRSARLAALRTKYPEYRDLSDRELSSRLATKYPEDADVHVVWDDDVQKVVKAYLAEIHAEVTQERWKRVGFVALGGIAPCLALYALGWTIAWVYRGFKLNPASREPRER